MTWFVPNGGVRVMILDGVNKRELLLMVWDVSNENKEEVMSLVVFLFNLF